MISVSITLQKLPLYSSNQNFFTIIIYIFMHDFLRKYLIAAMLFLFYKKRLVIKDKERQMEIIRDV